MANLEYLIIYTNEGVPIYSRCFANQCKVSMKDDVLFSMFLSSLQTFASLGESEPPASMELEGEMININYTPERRVNTIEMRDLELVFYYTRTEDITVAVGVDEKVIENPTVGAALDQLLMDVEVFLERYHDTKWHIITNERLAEFEAFLLRDVVDPFFDKYDINNRCGLGDNCPYRLAMYEGEGLTIYEKLAHKVREIGKKSILYKMKLMMFGSKYKLPVIG